MAAVIFLQMKARVVWVSREDKFIGLSLKAPIVLGTGFQFGELDLGSTIDDAQVVYQDGSHALVLDLGSGHMGFAPVSLKNECLSHCVCWKNEFSSTLPAS